MKLFIKRSLLSFLIAVLISAGTYTELPAATTKIHFVLISEASHTMKIGDTFYLAAITDTGKMPSFTSSKSSVASVNNYGKVTAKSAGTTTITAKTTGAKATCKITVQKTTIKLNTTAVTLECDHSATLRATTSNNSKVSFKCNKKSVATITENGLITAHKPGEAVITVRADGSEVTCKVVVKKPIIALKRAQINIHPGQTYTLEAATSSGRPVTWSINQKSVAVISENNILFGIKPGVAIVTAKLDGTERTCIVNVLEN